MKIRRLNNAAVSNLLGYMLSITLIFSMMSSSILYVTSSINARSHEAAELEAQNIVNQIADATLNAVTVSQSIPNARFYNFLELPDKIAGFKYSVTMNNDNITVSTSDGKVVKTSPNYNTQHLQFDIQGELSGGGKGVAIAYIPPEYIYKLDLGDRTDDVTLTPDSEQHSPVKSGYFMVTENSIIEDTSAGDPDGYRDQKWYYGADAIPADGQIGACFSVSNYNGVYEPFTFIDGATGISWVYDSKDTLLDLDPDSDFILAHPDEAAMTPGGLLAFDGEISDGGEPFIFIDNGGGLGNWRFDSIDNNGHGLSFYDDNKYFYFLDPDGNGIDANPVPGIGMSGGLYALDETGEAYTFTDRNGDGIYDTAGLPPPDAVIEPNADPIISQFRIPIKIDNTGGAINFNDIPIKLNLSSQDIDINKMMGTSVSNLDCIFYDPVGGRELPFYVDYMKSYDPDNPDWYFGASDIIKENVVFYVNITVGNVPGDDTRHIYFYYGANKYTKNDVGRVAEFYDEFDTKYSWWERTYCGTTDEQFNSIARDDYDFIYAVGYKENGDGDKEALFKQFDWNGYEYTAESCADPDNPNPDPGWNITWGPAVVGNNHEALSVAADGHSNARIYIVGYAENLVGVGKDWFITKYNRTGHNQWTSLPDDMITYDGGDGDDEAKAVAIDEETDHIYVVGYKTTTGHEKDWKIAKYNKYGVRDIPFSVNADEFNGIANRDDIAYAAAVYNNATPAGLDSIYVVGTTDNGGMRGYDWWIKKFGTDGTEDTTNWNKIISNNGKDEALSVAVDENGDVYVCGYMTESVFIPHKNWYIMKFREDGTEITTDKWPITLDGELRDDIAYSIAIDKSSTSSDWMYTDGEEIELNPDRYIGSHLDADPQNGDLGGVYAVDGDKKAYVFKDTDPKWEYNNENIIYFIDDQANPQPIDPVGLYALDSSGIPYIFEDKNGNWKYDATEIHQSLPGCTASPGNGDRGGLYAFDGDIEEPDTEPYTFRDLNYVYVAGDLDGNWEIKKYTPGGTSVWNKTYDSTSNGDSVRSLVIDSSSYVYAAGYGQKIGGGNTGVDGRIKKLSSSSSENVGTYFNPEKWSMSKIKYLSYYNRYSKKLPSSSNNYDYRILSKDYTIPPIGDKDLYIVDYKTNHYGYSEVGSRSECHSGLMLLCQGDKVNYHLPNKKIADGASSYIFSVKDILDKTSDYDYLNTQINVTKFKDGDNDLNVDKEISYLKSAGISGEGIRVTSYIYKDKPLVNDHVGITSYLFHPSTNAPYESSIELIDNIDPKFDSGRIGIVNFHNLNLEFPHDYNQQVGIDWIYVIKTKNETPAISSGSPESINYGWKWGTTPTGTGVDSSPLIPDPLHDDYIIVPLENDDIIEEYNRFNITKLPQGIYSITLTIGSSSDAGELKYAYKKSHHADGFVLNDFESNDSIPLPATTDEYQRVRFKVEVPEGEIGDIVLLFYGDDDSGDTASISCITVQEFEQIIGIQDIEGEVGFSTEAGT